MEWQSGVSCKIYTSPIFKILNIIITTVTQYTVQVSIVCLYISFGICGAIGVTVHMNLDTVGGLNIKVDL